MAYVPLSQARTNLGLASSSSSSPTGGYVSLDQARTKLLTANKAKPAQTSLPQIQTPAKGFKTGQTIPNFQSILSGVGNEAMKIGGNAIKEVQNIIKPPPAPKPVTLSTGSSVTLTQPSKAVQGLQPDLGTKQATS